MLLRQIVDDDLGCASYLIGDEDAGEAVLVDPVFDIDPLLAESDRAGLRVTRVLELAQTGPESAGSCANHPRNAAVTNCGRCGV